VASISAARDHFPAGIVEIPVSFLLLVPSIAVVVYLPFYFQMESAGIQGIGAVMAPTGPVEFLLVNGFFIVFILVYLAREIGSRPYLLLIPPSHSQVILRLRLYSLPLVFLRKENKPAQDPCNCGLNTALL
jgi:uncharacterized membrane protein